MNRKEFLGFLGSAAAGYSFGGFTPPPAQEEDDWLLHYCPSGTSIGQNLETAKNLSEKSNKDVFFCFNYSHFYKVKPDRTWSYKFYSDRKLGSYS
jgi:hypothetical protein